MSRGKLLVQAVCLLYALLMMSYSNSYGAEKKAVVSGASTANLRSGADQIGFIDQYFLKIAAQTSSNMAVAGPTLESADTASKKHDSAAASQVPHAPSAATTPQTSKFSAAAKAPVAKELPTATAGKSRSVLQMIEGHENEVMIAAAVGAGCFVIGWIFGGRYYLRRDRTRRSRIHF